MVGNSTRREKPRREPLGSSAALVNDTTMTYHSQGFPDVEQKLPAYSRIDNEDGQFPVEAMPSSTPHGLTPVGYVTDQYDVDLKLKLDY